MRKTAADLAKPVSSQILETRIPRLTCGWAEDRSQTNFISTLFRTLDANETRYCVLHSWAGLPESLSSDLDIAVHPQDAHKLPVVFRSLCESGYTPVQLLNYFVNAYYFVFFWVDSQVIRSVAVDIIFEHRRGGLIAPSGESLMRGRRRYGSFWIPAPEAEFVYLLAKKTCKGKASKDQALRLKALVEQLGRPASERLTAELFLKRCNARVVEACASGELDSLLPTIRRQTWVTSFRRNPWKLMALLLSDTFRKFRRWIKPTGLFVVVMGIDGVGKSTVIKTLIEVVGPAFRRDRLFHWRPGLVGRRKTADDTTQPHGSPPRSNWSSAAKLLMYLLDYWLGYCFVIRPLLSRSGFVVFDRYFDDLLIDPKRYRYGGPQWLANIACSLVPKPDLVLLLDAPAETVLSRKQELPLDEAQRQRRAYRLHKYRALASRIIDATAPISSVTAESGESILDFLAGRFSRRHPRWFSKPRVDSSFE